jgi:tetratricopeptide (TPR) repeat protein
MSKGGARWTGAGVAALLLAGCGSPPAPAYVRDNEAALELSRRGQHAEAAARYERAAADADRPRDAEEARYRAAASYARAGDVTHARSLYEKLANEAHDLERRARADFALGELLEAAGDAAAAQAHWAAAIERHPSSGNARSALVRHLDYLREQGGSAAVLAYLDVETPKLAQTELGESVCYFRARELDTLERATEARDGYLDCARRYPYPGGAFWDDALFRAAEKELQLGAPAQAIAHLQQMLAERESANFVGSYEKGRFAEAQLKLGQIYRDALHDDVSARRELRKVWLNHPKNRLADDALFEEALLAHAAKDERGACEPLGIIVSKLPESRYAACAHELCSSLPAGAAPCHDYIKRAAGLP